MLISIVMENKLIIIIIFIFLKLSLLLSRNPFAFDSFSDEKEIVCKAICKLHNNGNLFGLICFDNKEYIVKTGSKVKDLKVSCVLEDSILLMDEDLNEKRFFLVKSPSTCNKLKG